MASSVSSMAGPGPVPRSSSPVAASTMGVDPLVLNMESTAPHYYQVVEQAYEVTSPGSKPRPASFSLPAAPAPAAVAAAVASTPPSLSNQKLRHSFYAKCGFRSLDDKRSSLETMLSDISHLDLAKLAQYVIRNPLTPSHRERVWKLLLEITPITSSDCQIYVSEVQRAICQDLLSALKVLGLIHTNCLEDVELVTPRTMCLMYLLEFGELPPSNQLITLNNGFCKSSISDARMIQSILSDKATSATFDTVYRLLAVSNRFIEIAGSSTLFGHSSSSNIAQPDLLSIYFLIRNFIKDVLQRHRQNFVDLAEKLLKSLEQDDKELFEMLTAPGGSPDLDGRTLIIQWFVNCFNFPLLPNDVLVKIWDRVIAGNHKILACIAKQVLNVRRSHILASKKDQFKSLLQDTPLSIEEVERFSKLVDL